MKHISITGSLGSGKSAVAKRLKELLGMEIESIGSIQRKMGAQYGMTTIEFNQYMENHHEIDEKLDEFVKKEGLSSEWKIFDSRLAWHFIPSSLKVYLYADENIAADRIFKDNQRIGEGYQTLEETLYNIRRRRRSEILRYRNQYNIDLENLSNYDVVIDTSYTTINDNALLVKKIYESKDTRLHYLWISPRSLKPTEKNRNYGLSYIRDINRLFYTIDTYIENPIKVLFYNDMFYIFDGHKRTLNALELNFKFVPCLLINNTENYRLFKTETVKNYIEDNNTPIVNADWSDVCDAIINKNK